MLSPEDQRRVRDFIEFLNEHHGKPLHQWPSRTVKLAALIHEVRAKLIAAADDLIADLLSIAEDEGLADAGDLPAKLARWHAAKATLEPSPSPVATPLASPLPSASPDGAGASCGPLASAAGAARIPPGPPACKACGSSRLRQSDTSDHPGVVRCDACGLVQYA